MNDATRATDEVEVHLLRVPVQVHLEARDHLSALQRELELVRRSEGDVHTVPARLHAVLDTLAGSLGRLRSRVGDDLGAAVERGDATVDLHYRLPVDAAPAARQLSDLLDEVDELSRAGQGLLTVVSSERSARYRRWFLGELERQVAGGTPQPWSDAADAPPPSGARLAPDTSPSGVERATLPVGWSLQRDRDEASVVVTGPLDLESAPALRAALVDLITPGSTTVVDLTGCDFLDSVGVSVLLAATARAGEEGASVSYRLSDATLRVLEIAGILDRLPVEA